MLHLVPPLIALWHCRLIICVVQRVVVAVLACLALCHARVSSGATLPVNRLHTTAEPYDPDTALSFVYYSAVAYCPEPLISNWYE